VHACQTREVTGPPPLRSSAVAVEDASRTYRVAAGTLEPLARLMTRRDWRGQHQLQRPGGLLVIANHISNVDFLVIADFVHGSRRPVRFLAKDSLFTVPVVGRVLSGAEQIPVHRAMTSAGDALVTAVAALQAGECVVVYPEGTLTRDPQTWPMLGKTGAARMALRTGVPVVPVAQWGAQAILPAGSRLPRVFGRQTVQVEAGPPLDLSRFRGQPLDGPVLRELTELFMSTLTTMVGRLRVEQPPVGRWDPVAGERRLG